MRYLLLISILFFINLASAQWSWPVQVNSFTSGPYYNYLSYYGDQNDHLQILITLTDQNATSVPAKLRLRIEGAGWWVETKPNNNIPPFNLEPFVPNVISGGFLQPYLLQSNLIKSDPSLDLNNLPEGYTEVCVEVIGVGGTLTTIGGNQCTPFWLQRFQPPQAFVPQCGAQLDTNTMFHTFQWTVPIGYTPTIGSDLEYTFSLYEWVDQNNYTIFQTGQGLVFQQTVNVPLIQVSDLDVQLQNGMDYVWRVQAQLYDNGMPISMFENNGLSEICTFTYGEAQTLEEQLTEGLYIDLSAMANTQYKGSANWIVTDQVSGGLSTYNSYFIEYRLKPDQEHPNPIWHYDTVYSTGKALYQLSPERTYQVRVSGMAGNFTSDPTPIVEFTTPAAVDYACGDVQVPYRPSTVIPNENIIAGDQVQIGQFVMTITEAIPQYEAGRYAGQGLIPVEFLGGAKARVTFTDILIDKDYIVHEGRVDVTTDGVDAWLNEQMQNFVDPIYVDGTVDSAWVDTTAGVAWVVIDGVQHEFVFDPPDYPIVIHDNSGMAWTIYPNGVITVSGYLDPSNDHLDVSADSVAVFAQSTTERFGFDAKQHMEWHENYEIIQLTDSSYYFVPNKSIGKNAVDTVDIDLAYATTPTFKLDDETTLGFSQQSGNTYSVYIPAISSTGGHEIYAYDNNDQRLGKLNVQVYKQKDRELIVVPIANTSVNASQLKAVLDQTLGEANLNVSVSVAPQWNDTTFTTSKTIALPEDLSVMTDYSQDMRDLRNAYFADTANEKNSNAYYLFVIPEFDDPNTDGYMVKGKALGFIKGNNYQTYAHELAHGMGGLGHTWKFNGPAQGSTDNLMDYASTSSATGSGNNVNLTKAQWKELRDFDLAPSMWDDVEDAMYQWEEYMVFYENEPTWAYIDENDRDKAFFLLNGYPYKFDQTGGGRIEQIIFDKYGRVFGFQTEDLTQYEAAVTLISSTNQPCATGYLPKDSLSVWWHLKDPNHPYVTASQSEYMEQHSYQFSLPNQTDSVFSKSVIWIHNGQSHPNDHIEVYEACQAERVIDIQIPPYAPIFESSLVMLPPGFDNSNYSIVDGGSECQISDAVFNMSQGCGAQIYYQLKDLAPNENDLIELADYFSTNGANFLYTFYDYQTNTYEYIGVNDEGMLYDELSLIPEVFERYNIYSISSFEQEFPRSNWFYARGKDSVISKVNLWTNAAAPIPQYYNATSIDYTTYDIPSFKDWTPNDVNQLIELVDYIESLYLEVSAADPAYAQTPNMINTGLWIQDCKQDYLLALDYKLKLRHNTIAILNTLGAFDKYHYSMYDLVEREKLRRAGGSIWTAVLQAESEGRGQPVNMLEAYYQYVNKYNTESAFFLGIEYMKMYVENFFEPVALLKVIQKAQSIRNFFKSHRAGRAKSLEEIFAGINAVTKRSSKLPKKMYDLHKRLEYAGVDFVDGIDDIIYKTKNGDEFARINSNNDLVLTHSSGEWPPPNQYLDQSYIDAHLAKFDEGASYLVPKDVLDSYGRNLIGRPDGQFVMSKNDMDNLLNSSGGDLNYIKNELGIPDGFWENKTIVRIDIQNPNNFNRRMANGNEAGANELWLPGGALPNGRSEAVIDQIPIGSYTEKLTNIK